MVLSLLHAPRILVVGLGEPARGDEGIGIHLARSLRGTLDGIDVEGLSPSCTFFLEAFREYDAIILIDAVHWGNALGRVFVMSPYALAEWRGEITSCERALEEALAASRETGRRVPYVDVVGVCVRDQERARDTLSPELARKYDGILSEVRRVIADLVQRAQASLAWPSPRGG